MNDIEVNKFLEEFGDSTMFTIKVFSEPTRNDLLAINMGLQMQLAVMYERLCRVLCVIEEITEDMAATLGEYRGYHINFMINGNCINEADDIFGHIKYGFEHMQIYCNTRGYKMVENNV